ncbi:site-2 protease family protein [Amycolatopsis alkalitolerans]|uniref:Zinc metalloprotease n=1 Tax=Amycolatopsis alkalitolerans TaxID=2547244 RepID=A0A5C4LV18_9PSEU|nr:site-2 protease family protein [Amycolatopsis alkalitolerans]TNC21834.1 peptidase [Amycolatopsis alkalitolerans]
MFSSSLPLGRFAGIGVRAHWSVAIVLALLSWMLAAEVLPAAAPGHQAVAYWATAIVTAVCFLASLLAHELMHAVRARRYGMTVKSITLWMLGGMTELDGNPPSPKADLWIALSGPLVSLAIGGAGYGGAVLAAGHLPALIVTGLSWLGLTNLLLGVFNLLPGAPLDGGRVLRALVWKRTRDRARAAAVAAKTGQVLGGLLIALGFAEVLLLGSLGGLWLGLVGWFLIGAAQMDVNAGLMREQLGGITVRDIMDPHPPVAPGWWTVAAFVEQAAGQARKRVFPVTSFDGRPEGVVSLRELARLTAQQRLVTRVSDAGHPARHIARPGDRVLDLLSTGGLRSADDLVLVVEHGTLAGTVGLDDITRALELAALGGRNVPA